MGVILNYRDWKRIYESSNGQLDSSELAPIPAPPDSSQNHKLNPIAAKAYTEMVAAAAKDGIVWGITDSYRDIEVQKDLVARKGLYSQGGLAAAPGSSNHGWGSAVDLKVKRGSKEYRWLRDNAANFGFSTIPREPWHWEHKASAEAVKSGESPSASQLGVPTTSVAGALEYGARGEAVKDLQSKLVNLNYSLPVHGIDGKFGPETKGAVEQFQKENGLEVTGVATPEMIALLNSGGAKAMSLEDSGKVVSGVATISKDTTDYDTVVATVIDKLEGGYFHPNMRTQNPAKFGVYDRSGETMFGLDRHAGHGLYYATPRKAKDVLANIPHIESGEYQYKTPEAKEFWETIDSADAKNKWQWNYKGGALENRLRYLAGRIIKPQFESLANQYLSPKAKSLVFSDGRLLFHFIYATWNGSGWFQKFAKDVNDAVEKGVDNPDVLIQVAMDSRTKEGLRDGSAPNSLIAKGGEKIEKIVGLA
jgi:Putative peptidoglycan binding domain/D-alanyl-D-alanine carboxypeptidase